MIKVKAILGKIFNDFSDENIFNSVDFLDDSRFQCPFCHRKGSFKRISSYSRYMITVEDNARKEIRVSIPRIKCPSCGHTHALLPDNLIPFGSYTIRFVIKVLTEYLSRKKPICDFCSEWGISISTLYAWKELFTYHHSLLLGIMHTAEILCSRILDEVCSYQNLPEEFFKIFGFSFLQLKMTRCHISSG